MSKRILLTGASGFVGSHVLRHLLVNTNWEIVCPVTFRHKGNSDRIASSLEGNDEWHRRVHVVMCDLSNPLSSTTKKRFGRVTEIWNVASESHVDRSIEAPGPFIQNNVRLMTEILDYARDLYERGDLSLFLQMSTDEVYGPAPYGYRHVEWDTIMPSNPYSASKAAQEAICFSYWRTYDLPIVITNTMNIIGEMQDPEKFVPMTIKKLLAGEPMTVHVSPSGESGSRFYLHARNLADAWLYLSQGFEVVDTNVYPINDRPDRYHIVGEREVSNVEMVKMIANILGVEPRMELVNFHESRPGHDLRYALDGEKMADWGWQMPIPLEESLRKTVEWYVEHPEWLL
jgi:dTDP-glucose 4,6-dehydratase